MGFNSKYSVVPGLFSHDNVHNKYIFYLLIVEIAYLLCVDKTGSLWYKYWTIGGEEPNHRDDWELPTFCHQAKHYDLYHVLSCKCCVQRDLLILKYFLCSMCWNVLKWEYVPEMLVMGSGLCCHTYYYSPPIQKCYNI